MDLKPYLLTHVLENFMSVHSSLRKLGCDIFEYPKTGEEISDFFSKAHQVWSGSRAEAIDTYRSLVETLPSSKFDIDHAFMFLILVGSGHVPNFIVDTVDRIQLMSTRKLTRAIEVSPLVWDETRKRVFSHAKTLRGMFRVTDLLRFARKGHLSEITHSEFYTYSTLMRLHAGVFKKLRMLPTLLEDIQEVNPDLPEHLKGNKKQSGTVRAEPLEDKNRPKKSSKHDDLASEAITCQSGVEKPTKSKSCRKLQWPSSFAFAPEHFMQDVTIEVFRRNGATLVDREYDTPKNGVGDLLFLYEGQLVAVEVKFTDLGTTIEQAKKYRASVNAQHAVAITRTDYWFTSDHFESIAMEVLDELNSQLYRESREYYDKISVNVNGVIATVWLWVLFAFYVIFRRLLLAFNQPVEPQSGVEESLPNPDGQEGEVNKSETPDQTRSVDQVSVQQTVDEASNKVGNCNVRHFDSASAAEQVSVRHAHVFSTQVTGKPAPRAKPPTSHRKMW